MVVVALILPKNIFNNFKIWITGQKTIKIILDQFFFLGSNSLDTSWVCILEIQKVRVYLHSISTMTNDLAYSLHMVYSVDQQDL